MKECNCHRGPEVGKRVIGCPPKVININHPQEPVLFHRVDVPAAMGDDTTYPPENGLYKNVLLVYEANNHVYLYNSDGIPTSLTVNTSEIEEALEDLGIRLAQETEDRLETDITLREDIDQVADDLEEFKNSPDVVDIVATYADLQAYDTSGLGDKDVIRVLTDETHDDESSYYRWSTTTQAWTFIGATGPYYTKDETDEMILSAAGSVRLLTEDDMNWNVGTQSATEPYNCVALWLLPPGAYQKDSNTGAVRYSKSGNVSEDEVFIVGKKSANGTPMLKLKAVKYSAGQGQYLYTSLTSVFVDTTGDSTSDGVWEIRKPADDLATTTMNVPLAARQGKVLKDLIDALPTPPTVVQTTGQSTTDVMSQKAVTDALAGAGGDITKFYFDESESAPSAHINIYKDKAMTQLATSADVWNAKDTGFELVGLEVASSDPLEVYEYNVYPAIFLQDESMNESATNVNWCTYSYGSISMWNMQNNLSYATYTNTTIPTVVQTIGQSTTDVMSQKAVTDELFHNGNRNMIQIGSSASSTGGNYYDSIAIGRLAEATSQDSTAIGAFQAKALANYALSVGSGAYTNVRYGTAIGAYSDVRYQGSVGLGAYSKPTSIGSVDIGSTSTSYGYNSSNYRLLTGVYDPQSAHDAATKGYVDTSISAIGAGTRKATSTGWNTSAPLNYILQQANSPSQAQGAMFYTGKDLSDFPRYVGIGIYSADTNNEPWPYLMTQTTSDDGRGTTTGNPAAYRMALYSELPATFTTNEWNALWA